MITNRNILNSIFILLSFVIEIPSFSMQPKMTDFFARSSLPSCVQKIDGPIDFESVPDAIEDEACGVNHASTGAISFTNRTETISYVIKYNFVAKGKKSQSAMPSGWKTCITFQAQDSKPRLHSEIAFLQFITDREDPSNFSIGGLLSQLMNLHRGYAVTIYIKNSSRAPCKPEEDWWGPGISCAAYLGQFKANKRIDIVTNL